MFTKDELLMIEMVTGSRAADLADLLQIKDYLESSIESCWKYEDDLFCLRELCLKRIEDGEFY